MNPSTSLQITRCRRYDVLLLAFRSLLQVVPPSHEWTHVKAAISCHGDPPCSAAGINVQSTTVSRAQQSQLLYPWLLPI